MRKLLNKPWFVALLAIAAVVFVVTSLPSRHSFAPSADQNNQEVPADQTGGEAEATASPGKGPSIRNALKELSSTTGLRDPFISRNAVTAAPTETVVEPDLTDRVAVSAVWIQDGATFVLINNQVHRVGDRLGRFTLESANRDGVWVRHWKGRDFIAVGGDFTLTTPARQAAAALSLSSES